MCKRAMFRWENIFATKSLKAICLKWCIVIGRCLSGGKTSPFKDKIASYTRFLVESPTMTYFITHQPLPPKIDFLTWPKKICFPCFPISECGSCCCLGLFRSKILIVFLCFKDLTRKQKMLNWNKLFINDVICLTVLRN